MGDDGCPKCGHGETETGEIATADNSTISRLADHQTTVFVAVSCPACGYCEFYREDLTDHDEAEQLFREG
ncbi:MAG: zinc ribbon domain-containing protein [Halococcoides sp.]